MEFLDTKPMWAGKLPPVEMLRQWLMARSDLQTLISGLDQTQLALGIDTSHWEGKLTRELVEGADFVCPKATDGNQIQTGNWGDLGTFVDDQFHNTVDLCYQVGRPCIPYHFFQWNYDQWNRDQVYKHQYDVIKNAFKGLRPGVSYHGFAIDVEVPGDSDTNMLAKVKGLWELLKADDQFKDIPVLFYSSNYYLNMWPSLRDWLSQKGDYSKPLWLAQWSYTKAFSGSWPDFRASVLPGISMSVKTPGYANWTVVQWSASVKINGIGVDVNSWCRTKDDLYKWLNFQQTTPPPPPTDDALAKLRAEFEAHLSDKTAHPHTHDVGPAKA